jgi:hypothetical protein
MLERQSLSGKIPFGKHVSHIASRRPRTAHEKHMVVSSIRARYPLLISLGFVLKFPFARERTHGQLALVYDRQNRISRVLLLSSALLPVYEDSFFEILQDDSLYCSHPLVVPLALVKVVLDWSCSRLDDMERELNRITELTGQHRWPRVPTANPLEIDFLATTADLNDVGRIVSSEAAILASVILALQKSRDFAAAIEQLDTKERANLDKGLNNDTLGILMEERVDYFIQLCRSLLIQAEYIEKRNGTLMQVVSSLTLLYPRWTPCPFVTDSAT